MGGYPKPDKEGWEAEYRYAHAKDEVYASFFTTIQSWTKEADEVIKKQESEKDIIY